MIYLYVESEMQDDGNEMFYLCLSDEEMSENPIHLHRGYDDCLINAKGNRIANTLRNGGAQVRWDPLS